MALKETMANEPRAISKAAFESLVFVTIVSLTVGEIVAAGGICRALGFRFEPGWVGGLVVLNVVLARLAVDCLLKRFGRSRSGKTLEVREKALAVPEGEVADGEIVEVFLHKSILRFVRYVSLLGCAFFGSVLLLVPNLDTVTVVLSFVATGLFGIGALSAWLDRKPQAWANRDGITGYSSGYHVCRRSVPWSDVASCEIETFYDTFGKPVIIKPILKGWNGEVLLTLYLLYTNLEDQERLVKYIKAKLPRPQDHFWE